MACQTIANSPITEGMESSLTRNDISCLMTYTANGKEYGDGHGSHLISLLSCYPLVNPGGWAPPSVVRTIAKRELTKFLKKFSSACHTKLSKTPLTL